MRRCNDARQLELLLKAVHLMRYKHCNDRYNTFFQSNIQGSLWLFRTRSSSVDRCCLPVSAMKNHLSAPWASPSNSCLMACPMWNRGFSKSSILFTRFGYVLMAQVIPQCLRWSCIYYPNRNHCRSQQEANMSTGAYVAGMRLGTWAELSK